MYFALVGLGALQVTVQVVCHVVQVLSFLIDLLLTC